MDMPKNIDGDAIIAIINQLSSLSADAQQISDRLLASSKTTAAAIDNPLLASQVISLGQVAQESVEYLKLQIRMLSLEITQLHLDLSHDVSEEQTINEELSAYRSMLWASIKDKSPNVLTQVYGRSSLAKMTTKVRQVTCETLVDACINMNIEPPALWRTVISRNGFL